MVYQNETGELSSSLSVAFASEIEEVLKKEAGTYVLLTDGNNLFLSNASKQGHNKDEKSYNLLYQIVPDESNINDLNSRIKKATKKVF